MEFTNWKANALQVLYTESADGQAPALESKLYGTVVVSKILDDNLETSLWHPLASGFCTITKHVTNEWQI